MREIHPSRTIGWLLSVMLLLVSWQVQAASHALDRIEVHSEGDFNVISVHFNVPVRYVSHVMNDTDTEVGIQLQIIKSTDVSLEDLVSSDQLSWNPTEEIPLDKVVFQGVPLGTSNLLVSFVTPVKDFKIRQSRDFFVMDFLLKKPHALKQVEVKSKKMIDIDVPITKPPLSFKSLALTIYVLNLTSESNPIDLKKIAPVPVDADQALYTTKSQSDGQDWYRLRLGFFRTRREAEAKLKQVKNFYPKAWIDTADLPERRQAMFESGVALPPDLVGGAVAPAAGESGQAQETQRSAAAAPAGERASD